MDRCGEDHQHPRHQCRLRNLARACRNAVGTGAHSPPHGGLACPVGIGAGTGGGRSWGTKNLYVTLISSRRCCPSQMDLVPGSPSHLRPRKPPRLATIRTYSRAVGGVPSTIGLWRIKLASAFHSSSSQKTVHGTSGTSRPSLVIW